MLSRYCVHDCEKNASLYFGRWQLSWHALASPQNVSDEGLPLSRPFPFVLSMYHLGVPRKINLLGNDDLDDALLPWRSGIDASDLHPDTIHQVPKPFLCSLFARQATHHDKIRGGAEPRRPLGRDHALLKEDSGVAGDHGWFECEKDLTTFLVGPIMELDRNRQFF